MTLLNRAVASLLPYLPRPLVAYFSRHYIAGATIEEAVRVVQALMAEGACATIDVLGENVREPAQARAAVEEYRAVLRRIGEDRLASHISLKPTQLGLKLDAELCYRNIRELALEAARVDSFVRLDMEDASCTEPTLQLYERLHEEFPHVGAVLQAYQRRLIADVRRLGPRHANLRLCKGIYVEPWEITYHDPAIINRSFTYALERLLGYECYVGIATHDEALVFEALRIIDELGLPKERYEFQMLLGVRPELRRLLLAGGHRLRVYVPYGSAWFAYSVRRLKENPALVGHLLRASWHRLWAHS